METKRLFDQYYKLNAIKVYDIQKKIEKNKNHNKRLKKRTPKEPKNDK